MASGSATSLGKAPANNVSKMNGRMMHRAVLDVEQTEERQRGVARAASCARWSPLTLSIENVIRNRRGRPGRVTVAAWHEPRVATAVKVTVPWHCAVQRLRGQVVARTDSHALVVEYARILP